jgi:hypothetical protein
MFNNFNIIKNYLHKFYFLYLRYKIKNINNCQDIIKILNNMTYYNKNINSDELTDIITKCIKLYPLNDIEIQKYSLLQQQYDNKHNIENYVTFIFWISILQSIIENENEKIKSLKIITKKQFNILKDLY